MRVVYLCWPNGLSLHNVGRALVAPMAARGVTVDVVDSREWFARPTPADAAFLAHLSFLWPGFPYRRHVGALLGVVHDPDEVSTFGDRLAWAREPMHEVPALAAFDRVLTCSREMEAVLRGRYGVDAWRAPTFPHNADAVRAAAAAHAAHAAHAARSGGPRPAVRFLSTALGAGREPWPGMLARLARPRFWTRDEGGRPSLRQLRSAAVRVHRKNVAGLARLAGRLGADPRAAVDFRVGPGHPPLPEGAYLARLAAGDVYVCASFMEGGPLPVMEAVLAGLAVVTTPVGQTAEWVEDGGNGFVCRTAAELEAACRRYLDDPALLAAHRARSRAIGAAKAFDAGPWDAFLRGAPPAGGAGA